MKSTKPRLRITGKSVVLISNFCPNLEVLDLTRCTMVETIKGLENCHRLALFDLAECPVVEEEIGPLTKYFPQLYKLDLMCCNLSDRTLLELFNNATPPPPSSPPPSAPPPLLALPSSWTNTTNSQSRVINWCLPTINCFLQILNLVDTPLEDENLWKPAATRHMRAMEEYGLKFKLTLPNGTLFSPLDSIQQQ
eukprot:TRINITY_DN1374_c0_g1_i6.p1 TRINITY_DN1374_c0_g1~~TRINITY_DN1374_c0_g1_i6.p1  ORF type:complete len:194 (-),score=51.68 TRINITY_DN1374_c0_g1_i6:806-1387(-)